MRRLFLTPLMTAVWLLASPSLHLPEAGWVEVGAMPAAAQEFKGIMVEDSATSRDEKAAKPSKDGKKKSAKKKSTKPARIGSSGIVRSNQPGLHPTRPVDPPQQPAVTGTVTRAPDVPGYPNVPTVPVIPRGSTAGAGVETSQDRVTRCTHQGSLGGLPAGQQGNYVHNCAF